jgi:TonB family protein
MIVSDTNEGRSSLRIWIFAAVVALVLHVAGAALAIVQLRADEEGGSLGAQGRDIGLDLTSLGTEVVDLPPGPESEAVQASAAVQEQKAVEKETDLPKDVATETEDPDRIVTQADSKKPEKEEPEPAAVQAMAQPEQAASEASAPQVIEDARVAPKQTVVNQGIGKDKGRLTADWGRKISAYFELHKKFPDDKKRAATVKVSLVINRRGNVVSVDVTESSGDAAYDAAAISMVRRSDPVPPPPAGLTDDQFAFSLPVIFRKSK